MALKCNPAPIKFSFCLWREFMKACPKERQSKEPQCIQLMKELNQNGEHANENSKENDDSYEDDEWKVSIYLIVFAVRFGCWIKFKICAQNVEGLFLLHFVVLENHVKYVLLKTQNSILPHCFHPELELSPFRT